VVLDKPAGMVVHPGAGHASGTLVNALLHHVKDLSGSAARRARDRAPARSRHVGLMVVAKHDRPTRSWRGSSTIARSRRNTWRSSGASCSRAAHRRADRTRSEGPAEDVDPGAPGAERGDARDLRAHFKGRRSSRSRSPPAGRTRSGST
jgi:hypothetical protein